MTQMRYAVVVISVLILNGCTNSYIQTLLKNKLSDNRAIVFTHVNVVPMTDNMILSDRTVVIEEGVIRAIEAAQSAHIPENAQVIDASGKYLVPGLADMHVHISSETDLALFVVHGITTVQNAWGTEGMLLTLMGFPNQLDLRQKIEQNQLLGPSIYTAGPVLDGEPLGQPFMTKVTSGEQAKEEVIKQKQRGYDYVKVYDNLDGDTYHEIIKVAKQVDMPVKGHVPYAVGIDGALKSGQVLIDHLTGYIDPDAAQFLIDEALIDHYAQMTKALGVWNCPTIVIWQKLRLDDEEAEALEQHPGMKYLSFSQRFMLKKSREAMEEDITYEGDYAARIAELDYKMVNALNKVGAKILLGTDTGNPFVFPGWSAHEELGHLVKAGLTPYEAILAGTRNAAEHLGMLDVSGTVEVGKRADLILVNENPLKDVANLKGISGVMFRGAWLSETDIAGILNAL